MPANQSSIHDQVATPAVELDALLQQCITELEAKLMAHERGWRIGKARWDVDQDLGIIIFTRSDGLIASAPVQIIGTYNSADGTWLWGWDNPSIESPLQQHAMKLRALGEQRGWDSLTTRKIHCSAQRARAFAALACKLCDSQGAYEGIMDQTHIWVTFGDVSLSKSR